MSKPKLLIKNVSKSFEVNGQDLAVLSSLNLHVDRGEFVSLIGPTGSGKSTLFNIVAGLASPTTGSVAIDGKAKADRLGKTGYMPQNPALLPWKTVRQNVMLGPTIRHENDKPAQSRANDLLQQFGLAEFADQYPSVLSGGMAQKTALLRTILFNKQFLLMDEPFGALDAITRLELQLWLLDVWQSVGSTALLITHDIREAILLSDRIYVLSSRPATILQEIQVKLPRPRKREHLTRKYSVALEAELEKLLLEL